MGVLAVLIIPIAISVHTVVSWIMGMTLRAGWNSTIFGPYFVFGALFSGAAAVVTAMAAFRWAYHLEDYIEEAHFRRMGYLVIALGLIYAYFTLNEYLVPAYKMASAERGYLAAVFTGQFAPLFWFTQIAGLLVPILLFTLPKISWVPRLSRVSVLQPRPAFAAVVASIGLLVFVSLSGSPAAALDLQTARTAALVFILVAGGWLFVAALPIFRAHPIAAAVVASLLVNAGAWFKRFVIIVPTLANPFMPIQRAPAGWAVYHPTWVEVSITAAALAGFALIYILFSKVFPIVSIWETREHGAEHREPVSGVANAPAV